MSIAVIFSKSKPDGQAYVLKAFKEHGLEVQVDPQHPHMSLISAPSETLEQEAERLDLIKINNKGLLQNFEIVNAHDFKGYGSKDFFHNSEKATLLLSIMEQITTDEEFDKYDGDKQVSVGSELIEAAKSVEIIECLFPPHDSELRDKIFKRAIYSWPCDGRVIEDIYSYFGSEVAMYFAFMDHFTMWLVPPGIFGLVIAVWNYVDSELDVDNNLIIPLFSMFMIAWAVLFVQYLKQTCASYSCRWGTIGKNGRNAPRYEFKGEITTSKVTGLLIKHYPWYKRIPFYVLSAVVTAGMLWVAFAVMIISLNLQGYIHPQAMGGRYLHFSAVSQFSAPGQWFDNQGGGPFPTFLPLVPVILHAVVIMGLNTLYRSIAEWLTALENHRTDNDHNNSLIIKRIFFECFDCYIALFYLAFFKCDINALRTDLFGLYTTDSVRRLLTESVLPWLVNKYESRSFASQEDRKISPSDTKSKIMSKSDVSLSKEYILDEYEAFDDYLEMVIAFGYIILFATAFPLASALTIVCLIIEIRSDIFKLFWVCRRPLPAQVSDIGTWASVLVALSWLAVVTNTFIFAFTTEQMMQLLPQLFVVAPEAFSDGDRQHIMAAGMGRFVWGSVFCIEHLLFIFAAAVSMVVPSMPEWVKDEIARQSYVRRQESKLFHRMKHQTEDSKSKKKK